MSKINELLRRAQDGDTYSELELITLYQLLINKLLKRNGKINEDCKQQLTIDFILAVRRFDRTRY